MDQIPIHLKLTLEMMKAQTHDGVSGVLKIDSGVPGPTLGITACTHGNEPSGLAIIDFLLGEFDISSKLQCGTVFLVVNNIEAADRFFAAKTPKKIEKARYVGVNMNRLPRNTMLLSDDSQSEIKRSLELRPIWNQFTVALDIHSTTSDTGPMIISRGKNFDRIKDIVRGFPIKVLISNIDEIQKDVPAISFYGPTSGTIPAFAIEAGQHTKPESFEIACSCAIATLQNLSMIPGTPETSIDEYEEYEIVDSIFFDDMSWDFVDEKFESLAPKIIARQLLAKNKTGKELRAAIDGHLVLPSGRRGKEKDITEENSFISLPMQIRRVE